MRVVKSIIAFLTLAHLRARVKEWFFGLEDRETMLEETGCGEAPSHVQ